MGKDIRIISAGGYDTRGADVYANLGRDRRFINYYRSVDPETGKRRLEKRAGWTQGSARASGKYGASLINNTRYNGLGWLFSSSNAFTASADIIVYYYTIGAALGTITPAASVVKAWQTNAQTSAGYYHLISMTTSSLFGAGAGVAYYYEVTSASATGALTPITDADFPTDNVGPLVQKWGRVFTGTKSNRCQNSDANSITAYTAGNYFNCDAFGGLGMGVWSVSEDLLAAFSNKGVELLYNANVATLSPLLRANGGAKRVGLVMSSAICQLGEGVVFLGQTVDPYAIGVYILDGMNLTKISTPTIDQYLLTAGFADGSTHVVAHQLGGDTCVLLMSSSDSGTTVNAIACRVSDRFWFEWATSSTNPVWPVGVSGDNVLSGGNSTGRIYTRDETTPAYDDGGNAYSGILQITGLDFGSDDSKTANSLTVIGDRAASSDALVTDMMYDDDGTWTNVGTLDMSTMNRRISGLGSARKFGVRLTHSSGVASRIEAVDMNVTKWGH